MGGVGTSIFGRPRPYPGTATSTPTAPACRGKGWSRARPDGVLADKGYPSKANRAWLRTRRIAATIPERDYQIAHCRTKPGRPVDFGEQQRERYKGRIVVERYFNELKQRCGIAVRSDKLAPDYRAATNLAATLIWITTDP